MNQEKALTEEKQQRRARILRSLEKVSAELRAKQEAGALSKEDEKEVKRFLRACDGVRIQFEMWKSTSDARTGPFVTDRMLKRVFKAVDIDRLSLFLSMPEEKIRSRCIEHNCEPPHLLLRLKEIYQEEMSVQATPQAWYSQLVRE